MRRQRGKSTRLTPRPPRGRTLNGGDTVVPKSHDDIVESIRVLRIAFYSARDTKTRLSLQFRELVVTAPAMLRESMPTSTADGVAHCAKFRPGHVRSPHGATRLALKTLSRRYQDLSEEMAEADQTPRSTDQRGELRAARRQGSGRRRASILMVAAGSIYQRLRNESAFAAMWGLTDSGPLGPDPPPPPQSVSGNRMANNALWRIAVNRMTTDDETRADLAKRTAEGKTKRDVTRCLKRHIAREVFLLAPTPLLR